MNDLHNMRYIVFVLDCKSAYQEKCHDGRIFADYKAARSFAKDMLEPDKHGFKFADKAVIGMFVWDTIGELHIDMVETFGFRYDRKKTNQLELFK